MQGIKRGIILLLIVWATAQGLTEDMIIVQEKKGIVLQGTGVLAEDTNPLFISTFVKIKNPSLEENTCLGICELDHGDIVKRLTLEKCDKKDDTTGRDDYAIQTLTFEGKTNKTEAKCFMACLKNSDCQHFGIKPQRDSNMTDCILRSQAAGRTSTYLGAKEFDLNCMTRGKQKFCKERLSDMSLLLNKENTKFVNKSMEGFKAMIATTGKKKREKRYAGIVLGGLGMVTSGFALFETYQLKQHIENLEFRFEEFREDVENFEKASIQFHENIIKIYRALETEMMEGFERVECNMRNLAYQMLVNRRLIEWKSYMDLISKDLITGQLVGSVSPRLFNETDVKMILEKTGLRDTIYSGDISLFYRLSKTWVSKITNDGEMYNIHIVISVPNVKNHKVYTMYKASSVGLINGTTCTNIQLPEIVYKKGGEYYGLSDPDNCQTRGNIRLCLKKQDSQAITTMSKVKCLSGDHQSCELFVERCTTRTIQTTGGAMVRVLGKLQATTNENPHQYVDILDSAGIKFLNYSKYLEISADNILIKAIQDPTIVKVLQLENPKEWEGYLSDRYRHFKRVDMGELHKSLEQQKIALNKLEQTNWGPIPGKMLTILNLIMWVLGATFIGIIVLYCSCKWGQQRKERGKKEYQELTDEEKGEIEMQDLDCGKEDEGSDFEKPPETATTHETSETGTELEGTNLRKRAHSRTQTEENKKELKFYKISTKLDDAASLSN